MASWQGKGCYVRERRLEHQISAHSGLRSDAEAQGYDLDVESLGFCRGHVGPDVREMLEPKASLHTGFVSGERLVLVDGSALQIVRHYFSGSRFANIEGLLQDRASLSEAVHACGVANYRRDKTRIVARRPSQHEGVVLRIPNSQPVVDMLSRCVDDSGTPIFVTQTITRADRIVVSI